MRYSVVQKIEIWLINRVISVIWYIDLLTGYPINQSLRFASRPYIFVSLILIGVLTYFIYIPYLMGSKVISYKKDANKEIVLNSNETPVVLGSSAAKIPAKIVENPFPIITAKSAFVADVNSDSVLYSVNADKKYASASTTKLMTALVALNIYELDDTLTMSKECSEVDSSKANLPPGEKFTVSSLLNAMLVNSAGDAAYLLGTGKIDSNEYLYLMNEMAYDLKMENTFFTNTIGLDGLNGAQFSSAKDLYILAKATMKNAILKEIVGKPEVTIDSYNDTYKATLESTNKLLKEIPYSVGVKTGTTQEAGEVLIYEYSKDSTNLMIIVMGSQDRFSDTRAILDWALRTYKWE